MTLAEVVVVLFLLSVTLLVTTPHSLRWLSAEEARSAVYHTQTLMQLARAEAVARNRPCRFEVDEASARLRVLDLNDPGNPADDIPLASVDLSAELTFTSPDSDPAITLASLGGTRYGADFEPDGVVSSGTGAIVLEGKESWVRLSVFAAGGTRLERWADGAWRSGP
jgi:Tfp pilus assembly protein FimT